MADLPHGSAPDASDAGVPPDPERRTAAAPASALRMVRCTPEGRPAVMPTGDAVMRLTSRGRPRARAALETSRACRQRTPDRRRAQEAATMTASPRAIDARGIRGRPGGHDDHVRRPLALLLLLLMASTATGCGADDVDRARERVRQARADLEQRVAHTRREFERGRAEYGRRIERILGGLRQ